MKSLLILCSCSLLLIQQTAEPAPEIVPGAEAGPAAVSNMPPHLRRWLQRVRRRNPNEYQQLLQLWQTDPQAFREEIRRRLDKARLARALKDYPQLKQAYDKLSPAEKDQLVRALFRPPFPPPHHPGKGMRPGPKWGEGRIRRLVEEYHKTTDPEEKGRLRAELQEQLSRHFQEAEQRHAQRLEHLRRQLQRLEEELQFRAAHRDDIIQEQLDLLLESPGSGLD